MDKAFENMDNRFKNIEAELNYKYDSKLWGDVDSLMGDTALDSAFIDAASTAGVSAVDFNGVEDAFMDDAFLEGADLAKNNYKSSYFTEFKESESVLHQDSSFIAAAALSSAIYQPEFWNDADVALQEEGLHHEYKSDYWREAEKLLLKDKRKAFFFRWGAVATILLLLSFVGIQFNQSSLTSNQLTVQGSNSKKGLVPNNSVNDSAPILALNPTEKTNEGNVGNRNIALFHDNETDDSNNQFTPKQSNDSDVNGISFNKDKGVDELVVSRSMEEGAENENNESVLVNEELVEKLNRNNEFYVSESEPNANLVQSTIVYDPIELKSNVLGVKISKGLGNDFGLQSNVICPRNSLFIDYRFNPIKRFNRVSFGVDLGLYHMSLDNFEHEQNYSVYNLEGSVDHYWYKMTYKDLVFISTSFNTYFDLGKASKIRLGLGLDHLLTSRIGMEYQESIEAEKMDVGTNWGLNRGINKLDLNFGIGYEYTLNSKFSFLIDSKIGTVDKTNNTYLHNKKSDRDVSILLGLKYNLFAH